MAGLWLLLWLLLWQFLLTLQTAFFSGVLCLYSLALNIFGWVFMFGGSHKNVNTDFLAKKNAM